MISKNSMRLAHFSSKSQLHLMLFGAPGVGKGTYSKLIEKEYDVATFSMGEYFRALINASEQNKDPFLVQLKDTLRQGKLVDDETVVGVVKTIKKDAKYSNHLGLILDGVPRTIKQAEMLRAAGIKIDLIINFFNREDILLQKLMGRRVCPC